MQEARKWLEQLLPGASRNISPDCEALRPEVVGRSLSLSLQAVGERAEVPAGKPRLQGRVGYDIKALDSRTVRCGARPKCRLRRRKIGELAKARAAC